MLYSHVIDDALEAKVGKHGLPQAVLERELTRAGAALDKFRRWKADGTLPLLSLPSRHDDLVELKPHAERFARFEHVVVLGTGGSSLGGQNTGCAQGSGLRPGTRPTRNSGSWTMSIPPPSPSCASACRSHVLA